MKIYLTMPQPGETITQGTVVRWMAEINQSLREKDPIAELETEKALFEYESPMEGKLIQLLVAPQESVEVGEPIAVMEVADDKAKHYLMLGIGRKITEETKKPLETKAQSPKGKPFLQEKKEAVSQPKISPLIRNLLKEHNLDLSELNRIKALSPGGRITKEDILNYLQKGEGKKEIIPCTPIRLRIAENMLLSKQTIPHAHTGLTVDMTSLIHYREKMKGEFQKKYNLPLGITSIIFPALKQAIAKHPLVNASFRDEGSSQKSIVTYKYLNLGVAVDTPRGLYVVVIHNAHQMSFGEFALALAQAVDRAKNNRLKPDDLTGMTFTFNNYGFYGTRFGVQIILPPQSTTLGMGTIEKRPWVINDQIQIRHLADFTMAFDHRVMDGRDAGFFLSSLKEALENFSEQALNK